MRAETCTLYMLFLYANASLPSRCVDDRICQIDSVFSTLPQRLAYQIAVSMAMPTWSMPCRSRLAYNSRTLTLAMQPPTVVLPITLDRPHVR